MTRMDMDGCIPGEDAPPECHLDDAECAAARDGQAVPAWLAAQRQANKSRAAAEALRDNAPEPATHLICMADVAPVAVDWLWPGRIPAGRMTLLVGRPGEGKSFVTCDWAARISRGSPWPDGALCKMGSVILMSAEDDPGDTIRPRLDAAGADCSRIYLLRAVPHPR